jgi:long-chain acyl-CoA synthetase
MGSVGQALPGIEVTIDIVPTGDPIDGEIVVHGHCVMKGYHNLPEEDAAVFTADGGFRTGDIGHLDEDGYLFVTGRVKEQYKLENGKYVVPTPIEEQLRLSPFITNMMVYGANRPYNVGLVVPNFEVLSKWAREQGIDAAIDELLDDPRVEELIRREMENLSREIRPYERIKKFALINEDFTTDNGMLTPSLKVIRREVLKRYEDSIEHLYDKADVDDD